MMKKFLEKRFVRFTNRAAVDGLLFSAITYLVHVFSSPNTISYNLALPHALGLLTFQYCLINALQKVYLINHHHITGIIVAKLIFTLSVVTLSAQSIFQYYSIYNLLYCLGISFLVLSANILLKFTYKYYNHKIRLRGKKKIFVYGTGSAGRAYANASYHHSSYDIKGFIDDDVSKQGDTILGHKVYSLQQFTSYQKNNELYGVVIAIPSLSPLQKSTIISNLSEFQIKIFSIPSFETLLTAPSLNSEFPLISPEQVLQRQVIKPKFDLLTKTINNKVVLITGAGGSIGSELARIVSECHPKRIVLFDHSEYSLYKIHQEITTRLNNTDVDVKPVVGSVTDINLVSDIFTENRIDTVYHAAAYKHVPLVEANIFASVHNNVFGTLTVLRCAISNKSSHFTLISTDKAVRPTNVMGATKRIAELVCQSYAQKYKKQMSICMVRFGNVLGSSGSVIPLFTQQIREGGPVTVTHRNVKRYFMTIREASELVIQASALSKSAEVFLLDMGKPVFILDLAKHLVRLSGKIPVFDGPRRDGSRQSPNSDEIIISETGLRRGEKLYEELLIDGSCDITDHPKIRVAQEQPLPSEEIEEYLEQLQSANELRDRNVMLNLFKEMPLAFNHNDF